ncbi:hypothetical protein F4778DRAFT_627913 [Xylariomycetidae sp. FL2044]|nr:hypothetical protein F4778DRAFT_627913 [Xylariomycetidae sp. FL2044]
MYSVVCMVLTTLLQLPFGLIQIHRFVQSCMHTSSRQKNRLTWTNLPPITLGLPSENTDESTFARKHPPSTGVVVPTVISYYYTTIRPTTTPPRAAVPTFS